MFNDTTFRNLERSLGGAPRKDKKKIRLTLHLNIEEKQVLEDLSKQHGLSYSAYIRYLLNCQKVQP